MSMSLDDVEQLTQLLSELKDIEIKLNDRERGFVFDVAERLTKYGDRTYMSPKQRQWLDDIHAKYLG